MISPNFLLELKHAGYSSINRTCGLAPTNTPQPHPRPHKNLPISYNFLNLPSQMGSLSILYDATGRKWRKPGSPRPRSTATA
jgi:hypothetical protein